MKIFGVRIRFVYIEEISNISNTPFPVKRVFPSRQELLCLSRRLYDRNNSVISFTMAQRNRNCEKMLEIGISSDN